MPGISSEADASESGRCAARRARRDEAAAIRRAIDTALLAGARPPQNELRGWCRNLTVTALAEKVRRRAAQLTRLARARRAALIEARDAIILAVYAQAVANGWRTAWCDGSSVTTAGRQAAGIGGVIVDRHGHLLAQVARRLAGREHSPLEAEIAAASAVLALALDAGIKRVRLYSDCKGLVDLWFGRRGDARLAALRALGQQLSGLQICLVPRQHNQVAHRLARAAASGAELGTNAQMPPSASAVSALNRPLVMRANSA
jgi:ribonuclease HI